MNNKLETAKTYDRHWSFMSDKAKLMALHFISLPSVHEERGWMKSWPWLMWCYQVRRWTDGRATLFSPVDSHSLFPVGLKSIATSQWSVSNSCFVSRLNSRGPELHKLPPLWRRIERVVAGSRPVHKAPHCVYAGSAYPATGGAARRVTLQSDAYGCLV